MVLPLAIVAGTALAAGFGLNSLIQKRSTLSNLFDPKNQAKWLEEHRNLIGIGSDFTYSGGAIDDYVKKKEETLNNIDQLFKGTKVEEALKNSKPLKAIIQNALLGKPYKAPNASSPPEDSPPSEPKESALENARAKYEESAKLFGELLKHQPPFTAEQLIQTMKNLVDEGREAILKQQASERDSLKSTLDKAEVQKELTNSGVTDITAAKESMEGQLKSLHDQQLKDFDDSTQGSLKKMHDANQKEKERIIYFAALLQYGDKMRREIGHKAETKRKNQGLPENPLIACIGTKPSNPDIAVLQISDLDTIYTRTGQSFTQDEKGELKLELGRMLLNPRYYLFGNKVESDFEALARHIKALQHQEIDTALQNKGIEMDINVNNEELAKEFAKKAYEACINTGFAPSDITINVNGKAMKAEELYSKGSTIPEQLKQRAAEVRKQDEQVMKDGTVDVAKAKAELERLRNTTKSPLLPSKDISVGHEPHEPQAPLVPGNT